MPRGSDAKSARAELLERHPDLANVQTAEDLIGAVKAQYGNDLRAASLKAIDEQATAELDLDDLDAPKGCQVESATVRGGVVVAVVTPTEGPLEGRTHKVVLAHPGTPKEDERPAHSGPKRRDQR